MKEHIIRAILYQDMSVKWKDAELKGDVNVHLNVHQKTRQFVEAELDDFLLSDGEAILASFEKTIDGEIYHENPAKMDNVKGERQVFRLQIPTLVHNAPGEWGIQFFVVTDYDPITGNYTDSYPFDKAKFIENSSFIDDGLNVPTGENLSALYKETEKKASELAALFDKLTEPPDISEAGNVGVPSVEITAEKKFKFSNLKGEKGDSYPFSYYADEAEKAKGYVKGGAIDKAFKNIKNKQALPYSFFSEEAEKAKGYLRGGDIDKAFKALDEKFKKEVNALKQRFSNEFETLLATTLNVGEGGSNIEIEQTTGQSTTSVMSQKAVTDELQILSDKTDESEAIAKGRATGYVFDTKSDMDAWLENPENVSKLVLGDNLYIRATDVPDYWWDGNSAQMLETQKVDLTEYLKIKNCANRIDIVEKIRTNKFLSPYYADIIVKTGLTTNTEILTDEEKASACKWLGALEKPSTVPQVGKVLKVVSVNVDGTFVCEWGDGGAVDDVTLNGISIVNSGAVSIPIANKSSFGVVRGDNNYGVTADGGQLAVYGANANNIDNRDTYFRPITPGNIDFAVRVAMCDGKGRAWEDTEKQAARQRIGLSYISENTDLKFLDIGVPGILKRFFSDSLLMGDIHYCNGFIQTKNKNRLFFPDITFDETIATYKQLINRFRIDYFDLGDGASYRKSQIKLVPNSVLVITENSDYQASAVGMVDNNGTLSETDILPHEKTTSVGGKYYDIVTTAFIVTGYENQVYSSAEKYCQVVRITIDGLNTKIKFFSVKEANDVVLTVSMKSSGTHRECIALGALLV